ncbi:hypothetical protein SARC_10533 [Sphaeroforma arctica JP610]|uniref:Uncharacterized protein n=1 Tax=Sphaeroforma arctica JP610 TaxID=667725 RepID=A0A0L0FJN6_9EUKA|nr:hypothetical protein SARC_10533 [Sphaeroforma arctica JP610]KNC76992.1 hypothetical protein SARC_10533 [Sphaeroforma arctica JP610]|eukprot:XP_014150894.1 hypothetical protein SARC_10533 [Sphaeroforma arctica JP610]
MNTKCTLESKLNCRENYKLWVMKLAVILLSEEQGEISYYESKPVTAENVERAWKSDELGGAQRLTINSLSPAVMATLIEQMTPNIMYKMLFQNDGHVGEGGKIRIGQELGKIRQRDNENAYQLLAYNMSINLSEAENSHFYPVLSTRITSL